MHTDTQLTGIPAAAKAYRLADRDEAMIDLLARVVCVSVDTVAITEAMRALPRPDGSPDPAS